MTKDKLVVVTWNCAGALHKKLKEVASLNAEVLVVQECSKADIELLRLVGLNPLCWTGKNPKKGLALAAKTDYTFRAYAVPDIEWAIHAEMKGKRNLGVIAAWACAIPHRSERYIRQIHKLLDSQAMDSLPKTSIVLGDFNSNTIWDTKHQDRSHSHAVEKFKQLGYISAYHEFVGESQGEESTPTFYLYRKRERPYHIDYAFISKEMHKRLLRVEIGKPSTWLKCSDHMPVTYEFKNSHS
jgi:exonuclease III